MNRPPHTDAGVSEGDVLAGKYRIEKILGVGGMGVVVAAHHLQLDEKVAIKFLLPAALGNAEAVERFAREARAAVKIKSEHVARITDVGTLENGAPYMIMEYLEGSDLSSWLRQSGPLTIERAVDFVLQACEALAEAHSLGIVHRDLKPANLFCVRGTDGLPCIKVLDFGISKVGTDFSMTKTQAIMGSPLYMSPEQMASARTVDTRGDIWALGAVLFELVTGRVPFDGTALTELVYKIVNVPAAPLSSLRPDAPPALERIVARCLEKDRAARFQSVGELAIALSEILPGHFRGSVERISRVLSASRHPGFASLPVPSAPGSSPSAHAASGSAHPAATAASWGRSSPLQRRSRSLVLAVVGGVLALGSAGLVAAHYLHPSQVDTPGVTFSASTPSASALEGVLAPLPPLRRAR